MVDRTFSDDDIVRLFCNNLTSDERESALDFFLNHDADCSSVYEEDEDDKEKKRDIKKQNIEVKIGNEVAAAGIGAAIGATMTTIFGLIFDDDNEAELQKQQEEIAGLQDQIINKKVLLQQQLDEIERLQNQDQTTNTKKAINEKINQLDETIASLESDKALIENKQNQQNDLIKSQQDRLTSKAIEIEASANEIQESINELDSLSEFIPRGRNRRAYELHLSRIRDRATILQPCVFTVDKYNELIKVIDDTRVTLNAYHDLVDGFGSSIDEWFGF